MEVKIGVQYAPRELVLESAQTASDVVNAVTEALSGEAGVLDLVDEKGKRIIVPIGKLAYVEIDESVARKVGFAVG